MNDELDFLLPDPAPPRDTFRWATVTGASPLRIRFDGDSSPTAATPTSIAGPVGVGDRVWVQHHARSIVIIGAAAQGTWLPASLRSGWTGGIHARRVPGGIQILGRVNAPSSGAWSDPIAVLPPGHRNITTLHSVRFLSWSTSDDPPKVQVDPDGTIRGQGSRDLPVWLQLNEIVPTD